MFPTFSNSNYYSCTILDSLLRKPTLVFVNPTACYLGALQYALYGIQFMLQYLQLLSCTA